ncbi:MAG: hypothetical protein HWE15_15280 [Algoriphagus sp.]|uniref:hypothetical protein n=1 Tax=Algoriphagus sp. TaxID=1872435 RepID=UPI0018276C24|nr:hypothetical protein [Algoriphagus sp.]NVJ87664.1 hypothetical protein [Algoriphagus sp.]
MKNNFPKIIAVLSLLALSWACDNGYSEVPVVDTPPKITLGAITSGLTEGQDFKINVSLDDGVDNGAISSLSTLDYVITSSGSTIASGTEALTGDKQTVTITIAGGFEAGDYNLDVKATDTNGNSESDNVSFTVASLKPAFDITGTWLVEPVAGSLAVGPSPGNGEWFAIDGGGVAARSCFYDDTYTFGEDGSLVIGLGDATWLETWQGVDSDRCGTPVAPYSGGTYEYTYTSTSLTVIGEGAYVGLPKVNNAGEVSQGAAIPDQITYTIVDPVVDGNTRRMTLRIEAGSGVWWDFKLISGEIGSGGNETTSIEGNWKMEPIAGAFGVGPSEGSTEWFANSADDVNARACFFDDVYTFAEDGTYSYNLGDQTWLEEWQGGSPSCGTPVAPHDGSGNYTYTFDGSSLTLSGIGAHIALPKVGNAGELPNVDVPESITYKVVSLTEQDGVKKMTLHIEAGSGVWWTFKLISE